MTAYLAIAIAYNTNDSGYIVCKSEVHTLDKRTIYYILKSDMTKYNIEIQYDFYIVSIMVLKNGEPGHAPQVVEIWKSECLAEFI